MSYDLREKFKERVAMMQGRYRIQGETVRGEPRVYWIEDSSDRFRKVSRVTTDRSQAERWIGKLNSGESVPQA